jgi:RHS repeat-associated protein
MPEYNQYFYHPDHLGSSSFITDATGYVDQHIQYLPFGELFISQRNTTFDSRYKFTAKELDNETNYTYFGARYYDSDVSIWLSVDPLFKYYPSTSPFDFAGNNPLYYIDIAGKFKYPADKEAEYRSKYPTITKYLESQVRKDIMQNNTILQAYLEVSEGHFTKDKVEEMVTWDSGPFIEFSPDIGWPFNPKGQFFPETKTIQFDEAYAKNLEKILQRTDLSDDDKMLYFLPWFKTLTHEGAHYGDYDYDEKGTPKRITDCWEIGLEFEGKVWGGNPDIYIPGADDMYDHDVGRKVIEQEKNKDSGGTLPTIP